MCVRNHHEHGDGNRSAAVVPGTAEVLRCGAVQCSASAVTGGRVHPEKSELQSESAVVATGSFDQDGAADNGEMKKEGGRSSFIRRCRTSEIRWHVRLVLDRRFKVPKSLERGRTNPNLNLSMGAPDGPVITASESHCAVPSVSALA